MNFVLDTNIFHIDEASWDDEAIRDKFILHFLESLNFIEACPDSMIFWTEELESLLWEHPTLPPWRGHIDIKNQFVPIIYKKFPNIQEWININSTYETYTFQPEILQANKYEEIFKNICGTLIFNNNDFSMIMGTNQEIPADSKFNLMCSPPDTTKSFIGENIFVKWLENIDFLNYIWPKNVNNLDAFEKIIKACVSSNSNLYTFAFTNNFIKSITHIDSRYMLAITNAIKQRINMTREQATSSLLREEEIRGEMRIRITPRPTSTRIHFNFESNKIIFNKFYGEGEHDDGL